MCGSYKKRGGSYNKSGTLAYLVVNVLFLHLDVKHYKMKKLILFFILSAIQVSAKCQVFGKMVDKIAQSTVQIFDSLSSGSGIIVRDSSRVFLITAKHVIFDQNTNYSSLNFENADILFYAKNFKSDRKNLIKVDFKKLLKDGLLICDDQMDICVVNLADIEKNNIIRYKEGVFRNNSIKYEQYFLSKESIIPKDSVHLGENVFIVGFPSSIGIPKIPQFDYEMPLLKRGSIAGISKKYNTIIVDCPVYHGNSGGPVFLERLDFEQYSIALAGIVIEFIPLINSTIQKKDLILETSSYSVIIPIEYALNLINKIK